MNNSEIGDAIAVLPVAAGTIAYDLSDEEALLLKELSEVGSVAPSGPHGPEIVAEARARGRSTMKQFKDFARSMAMSDQCASPTLDPQHIGSQEGSSATLLSKVQPVSSTAASIVIPSSRKGVTVRGSAPNAQDKPKRAPRRRAAKLDVIAATKTWEGTRSKNRADKLSAAEKFSAAIWSTAAAKGMSVSLNLGIRRECMLLDHHDPHRRMMQNLQRHLSEAGFKSLPYAFVFELTERDDGGRLHLHGAIDTSGLDEEALQRLEEALRKAGSYASGALGGQRQVDRRPLYDAQGWTDYMLENAARTAKELGIDKDKLFMMNQPMRRAGKRFFEQMRAEARSGVQSALDKGEVPATVCKEGKNLDARFTSPLRCGMSRRSCERGKTRAGRKLARASRRRSGSTPQSGPRLAQTIVPSMKSAPG